MIKVRKFEISQLGEKTLVSEITVNSNNLVEKEVLFANNESVSVSVKLYDDSNNLIEDRLEENGVTSHKYIYDIENRVIKEQVLFGDTLYEEVHIKYDGDSIVEKNIIQDGILFERMTRVIHENETKVSFFDEENNILGYNRIVNLSDTDVECYYHDYDGSIIKKEVTKTDLQGNAFEAVEYNSDGDILELEINEFVNEQLKQSVKRKFHFGESYEMIVQFSYTNKGDIEKFELRDITGNLIQTKHNMYSEFGKITEEVLSTSHSHDVISGIFDLGKSYHYIYEYENA